MWIIPNNLTVSRYVRDTLDSKWDLKELSKILEPSVMWRSKPSLARTWLQRLKRVNWMRLLSGRILRPFPRYFFVTEYTSSLAVIPASPSRLPASEKEQTIPDTFGRILNESFRQLDLFGVSLKTSPDTLVLDSPKFIEAYDLWVTLLRQDSLQRQRSARHTNGSDCSFWPTSQARDWKGKQGQAYLEKAYDLPAVVERQAKWRTPNSSDGEGGIMENLPGKDGHYKLRDQVNWPTVTEQDAKNNAGPSQYDRNTPPLNVAVGLLAPDSPSTNGKSQELWYTPEARNQEGYQVVNGKQYPRLGKQVKSQELWRTPSASEAGAKVETLSTKDGKPARPGERAYRKTPDGKMVLQSQTINQQVDMVQAKGKLNPDWVEQLMGLPRGWTDLGSWETE